METCQERVKKHYESRIDDLRKIFTAYQEGEEEKYSYDIGIFPEYGLCFDYVAAGTFTDQQEGYFRYQLSWGGPSEEFRIFGSIGSVHNPTRIEFWLLDWGDGAKIDLKGEDFDLLKKIYDFFDEIGVTQSELEKAENY